MDLLLVLIKQNYYQLNLTSNWYFFNKDNIFFSIFIDFTDVTL